MHPPTPPQPPSPGEQQVIFFFAAELRHFPYEVVGTLTPFATLAARPSPFLLHG